MNDLVVLVADADMEHAMRALCRRYDDLGTRRFEFELRRYPADRDGGTRKRAHDRLRPESNRFRWALVLFDYHGCGSNDDRQTIQRDGERLLARNGWREGETLRAKVVVIEPELEAWMWGDLKTLGKCLGWGTDGRHLREWVRSSGLWHEGHPKPSDPKDAMGRATREAPTRRQRRISSALYSEIAESARIDNCRDPAFQELVATLRSWFPRGDTG